MQNRLSNAAAIVTLASVLLGTATPLAAQTKDGGYAGAAVTVVRAKKSCFQDTIAITGTVVAKEDILVRPDREGFQINSVLVEPGDVVTAGQVLARLLPPGAPSGTASTPVQAPTAGVILKVSATIGTLASARAPEPMFQIMAGGEFELAAEVPSKHLPRLAPGQTAKINVIGNPEISGQVRLISSGTDAMSQLTPVRVFIGPHQGLRIGAFGRAVIVAGQSCGVGIPLSAVLFSSFGSFVAVVRDRRVETRQVDVGLLSETEAEIRQGLAEGEMVVARAGAFVREGDRVRPIAEGQP